MFLGERSGISTPQANLPRLSSDLLGAFPERRAAELLIHQLTQLGMGIELLTLFTHLPLRNQLELSHLNSIPIAGLHGAPGHPETVVPLLTAQTTSERLEHLKALAFSALFTPIHHLPDQAQETNAHYCLIHENVVAQSGGRIGLKLASSLKNSTPFTPLFLENIPLPNSLARTFAKATALQAYGNCGVAIDLVHLLVEQITPPNFVHGKHDYRDLLTKKKFSQAWEQLISTICAALQNHPDIPFLLHIPIGDNYDSLPLSLLHFRHWKELRDRLNRFGHRYFGATYECQLTQVMGGLQQNSVDYARAHFTRQIERIDKAIGILTPTSPEIPSAAFD